MSVLVYRLDMEEFHEQWIEDVLSRVPEGYVHPTGQMSFELEPENYKVLIDEVSRGRELFQIRGVMLPPGNCIQYHQHPKWEVAIYMPMQSGGTLKLHNPDKYLYTEAGYCYEMELDRAHSVTTNTDDIPRVTLAMLFLPDD